MFAASDGVNCHNCAVKIAQAANIPDADVIVIGSGPNGLAAAITVAQAGRSVVVVEGSEQIGGGARTAELTLPGFQHDLFSAVYPLGVSSPFFRSLPLDQHGLEWVFPPAAVAHPLDDGTAAVLEGGVEETARQFGEDARAYERLVRPPVKAWPGLIADVLAPPRVPKQLLSFLRFGSSGFWPAETVAHADFRTERARAFLAGNAAHSALPLHKAFTSAFALVLLAAGHAGGWPFAKGGAQKVSDALGSYLRSLGGRIVTGTQVASLDELPPAKAVLCDITPRQLLKIAGDRLPSRYRRSLEKFRYGLGAFKMDWALDGPIPWAAEACARAGTVHIGGSLEEVAKSEREAWRGKIPERPFVILAQPSLFDATRAPGGKHVAWGYCHVPNGCTVDMTERIEGQIERFAPGFKKRVLARSVMGPAELEKRNPNLVGGDVQGGSPKFPQLLIRPTPALYATPSPGLYLCSASTPPGGGVHGMCGWFAAQAALRAVFPERA